MARRKAKHQTGVRRVEGVPVHEAWVGFNCVQCFTLNNIRIGNTLLHPRSAYETATWQCGKCKYVHSRNSDLPFASWPKASTKHTSLAVQRFWIGFFQIATEHPSSYWKQCNVCERVLPFAAFSRHIGWGPLERQMECRSCKGGINAILNPLRSKQQLHESAIKRRTAELLLQGENKPIDLEGLFARFESKCFKCGKNLDFKNRKSWAVDHILPSKFLYPLTPENAALLCVSCNNNKHGQWPSKFYSNSQLAKLSKITGAELGLLAAIEPILNSKIDVNGCVSRFLVVRERSNLEKRIKELKKLLADYNLVESLSEANQKLLGF